ncbi:MAG: prepilin-type N-terminal cleavage/methylation domain-containing protein [Candidatus Falkowbacteria bacterium]
MKTKSQAGFTLLEILLVVAMIAILAGIVILAINPNRQLAATRNSQRKMDVNTILNAIYQYNIDNGSFPSTIPTSSATSTICQTGQSCTGLVDLSVLTASSTYLVAMPYDPISYSVTSTGYTVIKTTSSRITVTAPGAEAISGVAQTISVTR